MTKKLLIKRKNAFTLIELLAVIVILAIIALIATPIILNIISDSKEESNKRSVEMYGKAVEQAIAKLQLNGNEIPAGDYTTTDGKTLTKDNISFEVQYSGSKVTCTTNKLYEDGSIYLAGCRVGTDTKEYTYGTSKTPTPVSFAQDSWETIAANVKAGNTSVYNVGDTKTVTLTGTGDLGKTYTVRIANMSSDDPVCSTEGYSQTACGFVIEFVDIITIYNMTSDTNVGGWPASKMRTYVNNTIYNVLPQNLKENIIDTQVVSSHGSSDSTNFTSTDKLYLLSTKEVWGKEGTFMPINYDTAEVETRQLDYYKDYKNSNGSIGVTTSNYSGAIKKYNGSSYNWWLRSAYSYNTYTFYYVYYDGYWGSSAANSFGVSPAFRVG